MLDTRKGNDCLPLEDLEGSGKHPMAAQDLGTTLSTSETHTGGMAAVLTGSRDR